MSDDNDVISLAEKRAQAQAAAAEAARERALRQTRREDGDPVKKPWVTWTVIGLNAAIWLVMVGLGVDAMKPSAEALLNWGGNLGFFTANGEWWRLLTAMFLHAGILHLAFNLYFAWVIGRVTEQVFGPTSYALIYLGSGLFASLISAGWRPESVSVGASGALFGVFGAFLGFTIRRRGMLPPEFVSSVRRNALILIGINLAIGFGVPGIDVAAHVGGLVAGLGIGYAIARLAEKPVRSEQEAKVVRVRAISLTSAATLAILLAGVLALPAAIGLRYDNPMAALERAEQRHAEVFGRYEAARDVDARIELLEREVIPMLRETQAELAAIERLPEGIAGAVAARERYFDLQARAFERELEGLRSGDPLAIAEAEKLHAEAIALLR